MFRDPNKPTRFSIAELSDLSRGTVRTTTVRGADNADSNYLSTASFSYESYENGLKSTQQLKVDWSKFENHTFFNSATAKTNVAFEKIINGYPFDGNKKDLESYLDNLTGFEKYVFDSFPRNVGYLFFNNSYISTVDHQGGAFPELAKNTTGDSVVDSGYDPYTIEFYLYQPTVALGLQSIFQKKTSDNVGITSYVKSGSSSTTVEVAWAIFSGSKNLVVSASINRGRFTHIANVYDRNESGKAKIYIDGVLAATSNESYQFDSVATNNSTIYIGSGSSFSLGSTTVTPDILLSGAMDELRVFKEARHIEQINKFLFKNVYAQDSLALYYKFNEPTGSLSGDETSTINRVVLDSSGNGMHSYITNFAFSLRNTGSISLPLTNERMDLNPVIFPGFSRVENLNSNLLFSASIYDQYNPNLITRLVPKQYLTEGQYYEGLSSEDGQIDESYDGNSIPGSGQLGSTQMFIALLYTWAKYFDELKLFVDAFSKLHYVNYDESDTSPDVFLPFAMRQFGIKMPNLFSDASFVQYNDGEEIQPNASLNDYSLLSVQNQIMRRILTNMNEIVRSKGTLHSIETFFRSIGIDPNNSFKIKERGGPTKRALDVSRETRIEPIQFLNFSSRSYVTSPFLSSSRTEVGNPTPAGSFVLKSNNPPHGTSNQPADGLWTSGSWAYEATYRMPFGIAHANTQSLFRMYASASTGAAERLYMNLLAVSGSVTEDAKLILYNRSGDGTTLINSPLLIMTASIDIFDGEPWCISVGKIRGDLTGSGVVSSSYFLRAAKQNMGHIIQLFNTSSFFTDAVSGTANNWRTISTTNTSGTFFRIGSSSIEVNGTQFLNATSGLPSDVIASKFDGQVSRIRFWSKELEMSEWEEHVRNPNSIGVKNPHTNFNFSNNLSGSWQRLRVDSTVQQSTTSSNSQGNISIFDYSQNNKHLSGSAFPTSTKVVVPFMMGYSYISPNIDEAVSSEKVRVRGYQDYSKVKRTPWAQTAPAYEVPKEEEPTDDPRLSIEFSLVDSLNRDIITMFSTMDEMDLALGAPENDFSSQYQNLEHLKEIYFNRLLGKLNFRAFFDFFRWFDSSVAYFVEQLIPRKTIYYGTNFVIESHFLERHKKQYFHYDMYLRESEKPLIEDRILLQQVAGTVKKF
jgi:hypothetical protein